MAYAGARVLKMAKRRLHWQVPTSPEFATSLHTGDACEEDAGCLANLAHHYTPLWTHIQVATVRQTHSDSEWTLCDRLQQIVKKIQASSIFHANICIRK